jgi:GntR family transcriptional repressor for pyruvate dehydrogenase complex
MGSVEVSTVTARTVFTPLDASGRADEVARRLAQAIGLGLLHDGERLPTESELAEQFGVSLVTLRGALATVRSMGLVETRRGRGGGSFIRVPGDSDPAHLEGLLGLLSLHEIRDTGVHRAAIAGAAAGLAATRALPADVSSLQEVADRLAGTSTLTERRRADARLHVEISAAAQSPRLVREEMELWSEIGDLVWLPVGDAAMTAIAREHAELIDAIRQRQSGRAREIAESHVRAETDRMLAFRLSLARR